MCGIVGSINFKLDTNRIKIHLEHRGPDAQNLAIIDNIQFYHLRLSIQDIAAGHQPMSFMERYTIIFNGEIYNHQELRLKYNLHCQTNSDTETLLHLYHRLGEQFLHDLDGMFVMAIYDRHHKKLFLARDRAGKKPLYLYYDNTKIIFASELNVLRALVPVNINERGIYEYLYLGYMHGCTTPYQNVEELNGGESYSIDTQTLFLQKNKWWSIIPFYLQPSNDSIEDAIHKTNSILHQSVKRRVEASDLEVGAFLSGGIDSGIVTAIASHYHHHIKTFTISFDGEFDEAPYARMVAEKYQTDHHEIKISLDFLQNDIESIIQNYGEPFFDSSAIPSYYVSQVAKKHLTVILNGDGSDELFGGYRRYVPFMWRDWFIMPDLYQKLASYLIDWFPKPKNKISNYNYIYRLLALSSQKGFDAYRSATNDTFNGFEEYFKTPQLIKPVQKEYEEITNSSDLSGLQKIMLLDFDGLLFGDLLVKMDIATMAHSIEGRSPFLGKNVLEYIPTLPDSYKIQGKTTKYLLRQLAKQYLPPELVSLPKRGFEIPLKKWVNGQLKEIIADYLIAPQCESYYKNFLNPVFVEKIWNNDLNISPERRAKILWSLFSLEVWYRHQNKLFLG
jgi:asparagine synthase (glutamine-hydrolysing)